jgi:hypothetical protein
MLRPMGQHLDRARDRRSDRGERGQRAATAEAEARASNREGVHRSARPLGPDSVGIPLKVHTRACIRRAAPTGGRSRSVVRPAPAVARGVARCLQSLSGAEVASGSCSELPRNRAGARRPSWGF